GDRPGEQHGQRGRRRARRRAGRALAGGGVRLRRVALHACGTDAGPPAPARLARAPVPDPMARAELPPGHGRGAAGGGGGTVKIESIVVPLDGTPPALAAVPVADALADALAATLH